MLATKFFAAAIALFPLVALAKPACNATLFDTDDYVDDVTAAVDIVSEVGQTITATIVDLATCSPYTGTKRPLQQLSGHAQNRDIDWTLPDVTQEFSGETVTGANTVTFIAAVPSGAQTLELTVTGTFGGHTLADFQYKIGVAYTAV